MGEPSYKVGLEMKVSCVREEDTVYCDLNAEDILAELNRTFNELRIKLTIDGRHAQVVKNHPFARLVIQFTHDNHPFATALLILRGYCYSYSFYANGMWINVKDSKYELIDNAGHLIAKDQSMKSDYSSLDVKTVGLSNLARAVMSLSGNDPNNWRKWYAHLVFVFIESARLSPIADSFMREYSKHVDAAVEGCVHTDEDLTGLPREIAIQTMCMLCRENLFDLLQAPVYPIEDLAYNFRKDWGSLSDALTAEGPKWSLSQSVAKKLELPADEEQQRITVADYVRIVKPPRL